MVQTTSAASCLMLMFLSVTATFLTMRITLGFFFTVSSRMNHRSSLLTLQSLLCMRSSSSFVVHLRNVARHVKEVWTFTLHQAHREANAGGKSY